jgi:hypothetical protein
MGRLLGSGALVFVGAVAGLAIECAIAAGLIYFVSLITGSPWPF